VKSRPRLAARTRSVGRARRRPSRRAPSPNLARPTGAASPSPTASLREPGGHAVSGAKKEPARAGSREVAGRDDVSLVEQPKHLAATRRPHVVIHNKKDMQVAANDDHAPGPVQQGALQGLRVLQGLQGEDPLLLGKIARGRETQESAQALIRAEGYSFPAYYDLKQDAAYTYGVYSLPTTLFLDSEGRGIAQATGAIDRATLQRGIDMILPG